MTYSGYRFYSWFSKTFQFTDPKPTETEEFGGHVEGFRRQILNANSPLLDAVMHYRTPNIVTHNESFRSLEEIVASILAESEDILNEQQPQQQQGHEYIEVEVANDAQ